MVAVITPVRAHPSAFITVVVLAFRHTVVMVLGAVPAATCMSAPKHVYQSATEPVVSGSVLRDSTNEPLFAPVQNPSLLTLLNFEG